MLRHGNLQHWFTILNLTTAKSGKSYIHYDLIDAVENGESGMCGENPQDSRNYDKDFIPMYVSTGKAASIRSYKVLNEGTDTVNIVFDVNEQNCKTMAQKNLKKTFALKNGRFVEK